jgi:alkanesulfonate monooxygenase SsuD/methylene tetrahydromethanopterin reductase-like flavin-dependent oxidoreductase (luciferase family)
VAALEQAGHRVADVPLLREAFVAETRAAARAAAEAPLLEKYAEYARQAGMQGTEDATFDRLAPGRFIIGSVEDCIALVRAYVDANVTWLVLRMQYPSSDPKRVLASIKLFGQEVISQFRTA